CFETGPEVYEAIAALGLECPMDAVATDDGNGKYHIDLKEVNRQLLMRAGVPDANIVISSECTKCSCDKYWSHRATNGERGTQAAFISLV
ncbi:MAG: laccase domain-containing protein, partial [Oscillospiraceae bacterium]|nr:laccase domain-containing protein [Oscillospiraceae bacterium]